MFTGNREFNEIYEQYKNLVLKAAYMYSGDNSDVAEDITQDTFLKLYVNFEELQRGNIPSWLFTTAKNEALNFRKKSQREILVGEQEEMEHSLPTCESAEENYLKNERKEDNGRLHEKIFSELLVKNRRWHDAILLVYYMDIPQAKAAEMLGMRTQALHTMLHRAKKWIRKKYGVEYEEMNRKE